MQQVHRDGAMTEISVAWQPQKFINDTICPVVEVEHDSDEFPIWSDADFHRDEAQVRAPGALAAEVEQGLTWGAYQLKGWAAKAYLADEHVQNADAVLDLRSQRAKLVKEKMLLKRERQFALNLFKSGVWTSDVALTSGDRWDVTTSSSPYDDIDDARESMRTATGEIPNVMVIGAAAYKALKRHPDTLSALTHIGQSVATLADIAKQAEIPTVLVGNAIHTTSAEGAATTVKGDVWGKSVLLLYVAPTPGRDIPSACYTFMSRYARDVVSTWRVEERKAEAFQVDSRWQQKCVAPGLGRFIGTVVS